MADSAIVVLLVKRLSEERAVEMLFLDDDIRLMECLRAMASADLLVCDGTLWGILGASSDEALVRDGAPK